MGSVRQLKTKSSWSKLASQKEKMKKIDVNPRENWKESFEKIGFPYHSIDGLYWNEASAYVFSGREIDRLKDATKECHEMMMATLEDLMQSGDVERFSWTPQQMSCIEESWRMRKGSATSIYGRFDFSWIDGVPKMMEYNADTPTCLIETGPAQAHWFAEKKESGWGQFNELSARLTAQWRRIKGDSSEFWHFVCADKSQEDLENLKYMQRMALEAGVQTDVNAMLTMSDIGWDAHAKRFCDLLDRPMSRTFKLYPWEWALRESFGEAALQDHVNWMEPLYKVMLSSKAMLPYVYEKFKGHPNVLPAAFDLSHLKKETDNGFVKKPIYSREGANTSLFLKDGTECHTKGVYGAEGHVYQALAPLPEFGGRFACVGSWVVGGEPAGILVREDETLITKNTSHVLPHIIQD
jgi:glutathionylspermidine synthase